MVPLKGGRRSRRPPVQTADPEHGEEAPRSGPGGAAAAGPVDRRAARASGQRRARRDQILRAAERVFAEKGFHAASISDVIDAAGISRGTFYLYFDSKRVIFSELLDSLFRKLAACVRPVDLTEGAPSPLQQLRANVTCALRVVAANQNLMGVLYRSGQGVDPDADQQVAAFTTSIISLIRRALRRGQELGVVRSLDDELVAPFIFGGVKEIVFQGLQSGHFSKRDVGPMVDEVLRYSMQGFLRT